MCAAPFALDLNKVFVAFNIEQRFGSFHDAPDNVAAISAFLDRYAFPLSKLR
jgi:hypothetical protein